MTSMLFDMPLSTWVNAVLVIVLACLTVLVKRPAPALWAAVGATVVSSVLHFLPLTWNPLPPTRLHAGVVLAAVLPYSLPFAAASITPRLRAVREKPAWARLSVGGVAGALLLVPVPYLQLALGCLLTNACP